MTTSFDLMLRQLMNTPRPQAVAGLGAAVLVPRVWPDGVAASPVVVVLDLRPTSAVWGAIRPAMNGLCFNCDGATFAYPAGDGPWPPVPWVRADGFAAVLSTDEPGPARDAAAEYTLTGVITVWEELIAAGRSGSLDLPFLRAAPAGFVLDPLGGEPGSWWLHARVRTTLGGYPHSPAAADVSPVAIVSADTFARSAPTFTPEGA